MVKETRIVSYLLNFYFQSTNSVNFRTLAFQHKSTLHSPVFMGCSYYYFKKLRAGPQTFTSIKGESLKGPGSETKFFKKTKPEICIDMH